MSPENPLAKKPSPEPSLAASYQEWDLRGWVSTKWIIIGLVACVLLSISARRTGIDRGAVMIVEGAGEALGLTEESAVGRGFASFWDRAFPFVFEERTPVARIEDFNERQLPWFSRLQSEPEREFDAEQGIWHETGERQVLIEPFGYLFRAIGLMLETIEIALWGTLMALVLAIPLAIGGTRDYCGHRILYVVSRGICSLNRAVPELISAMWFVLMFGFGAVPGILALGFHASGFLGKFFADDVENLPKGPQQTLRSSGANRLKVLRYAVIPPALPQFVAYTQYILERNVRTASVLGIVGAGGIGMELKGRWDLSDFGHVSTILLVIFGTVVGLETLTQRIRARII